MLHNKINAMGLLQKCGIGRKLNEMCHNSELSIKSTLLKACGFEHVELIYRRTSVLRDEIQSIKPVRTGLEAFLCFKLTNGACYNSLSADDTTTTSTSSSTDSKVETPTHSTMDAKVMNTSFELCSILISFELCSILISRPF